MSNESKLIGLEVTRGLREHVYAVGDLSKDLPPSVEAGLKRVVETMETLVDATERYFSSLDPEGWEKAKRELEEMEASR